MLLDGLDQCGGENMQRIIVRLNADTVARYPDVPILWVISSRPENHLKAGRALFLVIGRCAFLLMTMKRTKTSRTSSGNVWRLSTKDTQSTFPQICLPWKTSSRSKTQRQVHLTLHLQSSHSEVPYILNPTSQLQVVLGVIDHVNNAGSLT